MQAAKRIAKHTEQPRQILGARIRADLKAALPELAAAYGLPNPSQVVEQLIERALREYQRKQEPNTASR